MPRFCHATSQITRDPVRFIIEYDDRKLEPPRLDLCPSPSHLALRGHNRIKDIGGMSALDP
jgi:hypothetical protein